MGDIKDLPKGHEIFLVLARKVRGFLQEDENSCTDADVFIARVAGLLTFAQHYRFALGVCFCTRFRQALTSWTTNSALSLWVCRASMCSSSSLAHIAAGAFPASLAVMKMIEKQIRTSRKGAPIRRPASVIFTSEKLYKVRAVCLRRCSAEKRV